MDSLKNLPWKTIGAVAVGGFVVVQTISYVMPIGIIAGIGYLGYKGYEKLSK